jgi:hypothetical protein
MEQPQAYKFELRPNGEHVRLMRRTAGWCALPVQQGAHIAKRNQDSIVLSSTPARSSCAVNWNTRRRGAAVCSFLCRHKRPAEPPVLRTCIPGQPQDASGVRLRRVWFFGKRRFGWSHQHREAGHSLVSLFVCFGWSKPVVSGTHRRHPCVSAEPVGIPRIHAGEDVKSTGA